MQGRGWWAFLLVPQLCSSPIIPGGATGVALTGAQPHVSMTWDAGASADSDEEEQVEQEVGLGTRYGGLASPSCCLEGSG